MKNHPLYQPPRDQLDKGQAADNAAWKAQHQKPSEWPIIPIVPTAQVQAQATSGQVRDVLGERA